MGSSQQMVLLMIIMETRGKPITGHYPEIMENKERLRNKPIIGKERMLKKAIREIKTII